MKNADAVLMFQALERAGTINAGPTFAYWVGTNKRKLKPIVDALNEANKPPDEALAYEEARAELARSVADPAGPNPATTGGMMRIKDRVAYDAGLTALRAKYPKAEKLVDAHVRKYEKLLSEPLPGKPPEFMRIAFEHLPSDLTGNIIDVLFDLIIPPGETLDKLP